MGKNCVFCDASVMIIIGLLLFFARTVASVTLPDVLVYNKIVCPEGNDSGLQANLCDLIFLGGGVPPQISHKIIINRVLFAKLEGAFYSVLRRDPYHLRDYNSSH